MFDSCLCVVASDLQSTSYLLVYVQYPAACSLFEAVLQQLQAAFFLPVSRWTVQSKQLEEASLSRRHDAVAIEHPSDGINVDILTMVLAGGFHLGIAEELQFEKAANGCHFGIVASL